MYGVLCVRDMYVCVEMCVCVGGRCKCMVIYTGAGVHMMCYVFSRVEVCVLGFLVVPLWMWMCMEPCEVIYMHVRGAAWVEDATCV